MSGCRTFRGWLVRQLHSRDQYQLAYFSVGNILGVQAPCDFFTIRFYITTSIKENEIGFKQPKVSNKCKTMACNYWRLATCLRLNVLDY